jgi:sigma-B regulation protein RsbU (phosphoserine phosphatase)
MFTAQARVRSLLRLNEAVQKLNSTLDLDLLLDRFMNEIVSAFGCLEGMVLLKERGAEWLTVTAVTGCSHVTKNARIRLARDSSVGVAALTGMPFYSPDLTREAFALPAERNARSELQLPLIAQGEVIGVFSAQHPEADGFPEEQRALLEALAAHLAVAIENARLFRREKVEKERLKAQEEEAHRIQQALLPQRTPAIPGLAVEGRSISAGAVGGDFYDFFALPEAGDGRPRGGSRQRRRWGMVLADVAGKGLASALLMSATRGIVRSVARQVADPAEVLRRVNQVLRGDLPSNKYVTMIYAVLDADRRTLRFANAGHPWPIYAAGGRARFLKTKMGLPLGVGESDYDECRVQFPDGARLLLYTDGVTEAWNEREIEYGRKRLQQQARRPVLTVAGVLQEVIEFSGAGSLRDDATVLLLQAGRNVRRVK